MKRPILRAGVMIGALGLGMTGCQQTGHDQAVSKAKPDDPTAWSDKDLSRDDSGSIKPGLPKSSSRSGTWSKEAQEVEASLGVGGR